MTNVSHRDGCTQCAHTYNMSASFLENTGDGAATDGISLQDFENFTHFNGCDTLEVRLVFLS